ncbi:helix-turn-helix transcriptional regulator [Alloalcanivorax xenomutans]|uniref:helix-turn-helix transcriptional regulator n=1 Tax=Alloalcanivorax xenomutans TaxID=1094342 RepID=UPI003BACAD5E
MTNELLGFVGEIYEASYNPGHWDAVATGLCQLLNARSGAILLEDHEGRTRGMIGAHGLPKPVRAAYRFGISRYDYTFQLQRRAPLGKAHQLIRAEDVRTEHPFYYRLVLKPNDIGFLAAMNVYNDISEQHGVSVETIRSQLKSIYLKMGVNKQQDVIRTLLSGVVQIS